MPNHGTGPKSGLCRERGKRSGLTSTARPQAMCWTRRPAAAAAAAAAVVTAAAALPCHSCSTLWRDPETRGAVPRAGLRRHAFAVRLAGLLLSSNEKTPPK